jgi:hypothetical protein
VSRLATAWAGVSLVCAVGFLAPEAFTRPARGIARSDLDRSIRIDSGRFADIERRLSVTGGSAGDDEQQTLLESRLAEFRSEALIRDLQTASLLLAGIASLIFFAGTLPSAVRLRGSGPGGGIVDVMAAETVNIDEAALAAETKGLRPSRRAAIEALVPPLRHCAYCGRATRWKLLGRVRHRTLMKRPPPGAKDLSVKLADGWWFESAPHAPCAKCGSTDSVVG